MKKLIFIIVLISIGFAACGQRENMLPMKASSALTDTMRVIKDNQSSLMLRSTWQGDLYDSIATHTDTLQALRADIDAGGSVDVMDSIAVHRTELNNLHDSITDHRTDIDANLDSIAAHRTELDNAVDSIAAHRAEINANTSTGSTNGSNISANSVFIGVNTADIASLEDSITDHRAELDNHTDSIAAHLVRLDNLNDSIYKHTDTLQLHQTQIAALGPGAVSDSSWTSITVDTIKGKSEDANIVFTNELGDVYAKYNIDGSNSLNVFDDKIQVFGDINIDGGSISYDASNNLAFTDAVTGTKTLAELAAGGGTPDSSWTSIRTDTIRPLDSDLLSTIFYTSPGSYLKQDLYRSADSSAFVNINSNPEVSITSYISYGDTVSGVLIDPKRVILDVEDPSGNSNITLTSSDITFYDPSTGTKTLADLAGGGGTPDSSWVSIDADTIYTNSNRDGTHITRGDDEELLININSASSVSITNDNFYVGADRHLIVDRIMHVVEAQILYTNTSQTTIVTLPQDAVIWDVQVEVLTVFNGGGNNYLDIGITGEGDRYENNANLFIPAAWMSLSLTDVPDRMTGSTNITFQYTDSDSDATTGEATVYIHYTLH